MLRQLVDNSSFFGVLTTKQQLTYAFFIRLDKTNERKNTTIETQFYLDVYVYNNKNNE